MILLALLGLAGCSRAVAEDEAALPTAAPTAAPTLVAKAATPTLAPTDPPAPTATPSPTPTRKYPPVAIDPGHGGEDLGARRWQDGHMVHTEAQVNLDLGLRLRDQLEARGIPAYLTRDGDYALLDPRVDINGSGDADYVDEAQARVDAINATDAAVMISLHQNAFEWPDGSLAPDVGGTVVYYCADRPFAEQSKRLADLVHEEIIGVFAEYGHDVRDRGVLDDAVLQEAGEPGGHLIVLGPESVHIVRPVQIPGVLSETLFITHEVEGALAMDPVALDRFAQAYADAIQQYLDETLAGD
ncbi:MAG: N-acetylmuramoyl-L-alanine amidase [Anaerolineales bacterium]